MHLLLIYYCTRLTSKAWMIQSLTPTPEMVQQASMCLISLGPFLDMLTKPILDCLDPHDSLSERDNYLCIKNYAFPSKNVHYFNI